MLHKYTLHSHPMKRVPSVTHRGQGTSPESCSWLMPAQRPKPCLLTSPFQYTMGDSHTNDRCFLDF